MTCHYHLVWAERSNSFQKNESHRKGACFSEQKRLGSSRQGAIWDLLWPPMPFPGGVSRHRRPCLSPCAFHTGRQTLRAWQPPLNSVLDSLILRPREWPYLKAKRRYPRSFLRGTTEPLSGRDSWVFLNIRCPIFLSTQIPTFSWVHCGPE